MVEPRYEAQLAWRTLRRRCAWCARKLRWWQMTYCRTCAYRMAHAPSPRWPADAQVHGRPDGWRWWRG